MEDVFKTFRFFFEKRYNFVSVLNMGEDSVRYDFFAALQQEKKIDPWKLQLEYPIDERCFIPRKTLGSKRTEKPQIDLWVDEPNLKMCAEFGMFRRNSNDSGDISVTENTFKMLNDFIRLALHSHFVSCDAFFVCVADAKMINYQVKKMLELPAFPGKLYRFNSSIIDSLLSQYKSSKKFDRRFLSIKKKLELSIKADLVFSQEIISTINPLKTLLLVWQISSAVETVATAKGKQVVFDIEALQ